MKNKSKIRIKSLFIIIIAIFAALVINTGASEVFATETTSSSETSEEQQFIYLSDITYIASQSKTAWGNITTDKTTENKTLCLKVNGTSVTFKKGVFAHATSTIVYDLTNYSNDYDYFTTYYGVSAHQGSNGSVKFYIYTSNDGKTWNLETASNPAVLTGSSNATFVKIPIKGKKYLKLYADSNGANGSDHSLYADSKLIKEGYTGNITKTPEEYDALIKEKVNNNQLDEELELLVLQRDFVNNAGQFQLRTYFEDAEEAGNYNEAKETFDWLFNNVEVLRLYTAGGKPDGSYLNSLKVLNSLYQTYKDDLSIETTTKNGVKQGDLYRKMMLTLSLTHSATVKFWVYAAPLSGTSWPNPDPSISQPVLRYQIYKDLFLAGKLETYFDTLEIEELRYILGSTINDDEIKWMNAYAISKGRPINGYAYMPYINKGTAPYRYATYYGENRANYETKYKLTGFDVGNVPGFPKLWIIMEVGGVCWQISNMGQNAASALGRPLVLMGQPGHVAELYYSQSSNGRGTWGLTNDVSGWTGSDITVAYSGTKSYHTVRLLNGWGNDSYCSKKVGACYILLGQAALDDYDNYVKAKEKVLLANSYQSDNAIKEKLYREAIQIQSFNLDAWAKLVSLYVNDSSKTEEDIYNLAVELTENLKYYPLPMSDLLKVLMNKITSPAYLLKFTVLQNNTLEIASKATDSNVIQSNVVRIMANYLLGKLDTEVAKFSFDGDAANTLSLSTKYQASEPNWDYSLDGGVTWTSVGDGKAKVLTKEEIESITVDNDIQVHIIGVNYDPENIFTIDISKASAPSGLYGNDLENRVINATNTMEWRLSDTDEWTSYKQSAPDLTGNKTVEIRVGPNKTYLPSTSVKFTFKEDNQPDTRKYIPISNLSIYKVSSEATSNNGHAIHAIDGNINTIWHSNYAGQDSQRYIIIKLAEPKYISALEYVPRQSGTNGRVGKCVLSLSMNGTDWTQVGTGNWANNASTKSIEIAESVKAQYVKLQAQTNYGDGRTFISALMINLFEDTTGDRPRAGVEYSITEGTTKPVVATLANPTTEITVTNNEGKDSYTFIENGTFTFEYVDESGRKGSTTATVTWINDCAFSLKKEDGGKIFLSKKFESDNLDWEYSIDGGTVWKKGSGLEYLLDEEEVENVNAQNDVKIHIITSKALTDIYYTIDIKPAEGLPSTIYANDLENRMIGVNSKIEWRINDTDKWTSYADAEPDLTGNTQVQLRTAATELSPASEISTFTFTEDNQPDTMKYLPIKYLSIHGYSSQSLDTNRPNYAPNAIDGNLKTEWHTNYAVAEADESSYISIKLDKGKYISAIEYIHMQDSNEKYGYLKNATIYVSSDGVEWESVKRVEDLTKDSEPKLIQLDEPVFAKYVKITMLSYDNVFATAAMLNFYYDSTKVATSAKVEYDIEEKTNKDVVAHLVSENNENITILNNDGNDSYTFTQNGEFDFIYEDENGIMGTAKAKVDWIDKVAPTATVKYNKTETTNKDVVATIAFSEEVKILTENFKLEKQSNGTYTYTFFENLKFNLEFEDLAGNKGTVELLVNWINKDESFIIDDEKEEEQDLSSEVYNVEDSDNIITRITVDTKTSEFRNNLKHNNDITILDKAGNALADDDLISTGDTIKVRGSNKTYTMIVSGDIDGDGEMSINDLVKIKLHMINKKKLEGISEKAADMDFDDSVSINDLVKIKLKLIKK